MHQQASQSVTLIEKAALTSLAMFFTAKLYKRLFEEYFPLPVDLTLFFAGCCALLILIIQQPRGLLSRNQTQALLIGVGGFFLMPAIYSLLSNFELEYTREKFNLFFGFTLLSFLAPIALITDYLRLKFFVRAFIVVSFLSVMVAVLEAYFSGSLSDIAFRTSGFSANVIAITRAASGAALLCFLQLRARDPVIRRDISVVMFVMLIIAAAVTASRGPFYGMIIVLIVFGHSNIRNVSSQVKRILLLTFVLAIGWMAAPLVIDFLPAGSVEKLESSESSARVDVYFESIEIFYNNPFGVGFGNYAEYTTRTTYLDLYWPHNLFAEFFIETGFMGGIALLMLLTLIFLRHRPDPQLPDVYTQVHLMFIFLLLQSMVSGDMNAARVLLCFIAIGLVKNGFPAMATLPVTPGATGRSHAKSGEMRTSILPG